MAISSKDIQHIKVEVVVAIQEAVRKILADHSGGIKHTALVCDLTKDLIESGNSCYLHVVRSDDLWLIVESIEEVSIFSYYWDMGGGVRRQKQFIATTG